MNPSPSESLQPFLPLALAAEPAAAPPADRVTVIWPDGRRRQATIGSDWLAAAAAAGVTIPTGCLGGSCGACEIDVNGQVVRACIASVPRCRQGVLNVTLVSDPAW